MFKFLGKTAFRMERLRFYSFHYSINIFRYLFLKKKIVVNAFCDSRNFGDALNVPFIELIAQKKVVHFKYIPKSIEKKGEHVFTLIGSLIDNLDIDGTIIWGAGIINSGAEIKGRPALVCAVRGPLTRQKLLDKGIACPEIYGDPALLLPKYFFPDVNKRYKLGIIPHYVDFESNIVKQMMNREGVRIIDINVKQDWKSFIKSVLECEKIISTSLHGLIVADAYNIPSKWIKISDNIKGGAFKFHDYYESVGKLNQSPVKVVTPNDIDAIKFTKEKINIDLEKLLKACPFLT